MGRSPRNKTIDFSLDSEEGQKYLSRCIHVNNDVEVSEVSDQIIHGDCFQVLPHLPEKCADLIIADPPYNLTKDFAGSTFHRRDPESYRKFTVKWMDMILPLMKPDATIYVCCDWESSLIIGEELYKRLHVQNRITWQREKGRGARKNWKNSMEDIWFATRENDYTFNLDKVKQRRRVIAPYKKDGVPKDWTEDSSGKFRDTCPSNFWDDISVPYWSMAENTGHPTQKPEKLCAKLILASSNPGDMILDPFAGAGTSAVTASKLGRHFISVEKNELYCAWTEKRLEDAISDPVIQGYADGVFWERNTLAQQMKYRKET